MEVQKIDGTILETFEIVIAAFLGYDKARKVRFFEKTFLLADISMDVALRILQMSVLPIKNFIGGHIVFLKLYRLFVV